MACFGQPIYIYVFVLTCIPLATRYPSRPTPIMDGRCDAQRASTAPSRVRGRHIARNALTPKGRHVFDDEKERQIYCNMLNFPVNVNSGMSQPRAAFDAPPCRYGEGNALPTCRVVELASWMLAALAGMARLVPGVSDSVPFRPLASAITYQRLESPQSAPAIDCRVSPSWTV